MYSTMYNPSSNELTLSALASGALLVRVGLGWYAAGASRSKNAGGAALLHVAGGACALIAAIIVGSRTGKYNRDGSSNLIPGHSVPMLSVGMLLMLAGWVPYLLAATYLHGGLSPRTAMNVLLC